MKISLALLIASSVLVMPAPARPESAVATRVLVAYHSESGNTEALGKALAEGLASVPGVEPIRRKISEVTNEEIRSADGILLGTPVHWANLHARLAMRDLLEKSQRMYVRVARLDDMLADSSVA